MHTFVLVPGAGGDARYWSRLEPELRDRGHDVVAVTLPASDPNAELADRLDRYRAELVGDPR
ncbi:MAG: alpha/beta fold hydrolase [Rhodococcus fascians]